MIRDGIAFLMLGLLLWLPVPALASSFAPPAVGVLYITGNNSRINEECVEALSSNLGKIKSIYPVERMKLAQVFSEQKLQCDGIVAALSDSAVQAVGLNYVLIGNVNVQNSDLYSKNGTTYQRTVTLNLRLVDASQDIGRVVWSGQDTSTCFSQDATQAADEAVYDCMRQLYNFLPVKGCILKTSGERYYVDLGINDGIQKDDTLEARSKGEVIIHPLTGKPMEIGENAGKLKVVEVYDDYSIAVLDDNLKGAVVPGAVVIRKIRGKPRTWIGAWSCKVSF